MSKIKNNVISWDFDGTLNDHFGGAINPLKKQTRDWVLRLKRRGYDVHIITRRFGPENKNMGKGNEHLIVWKVADELGVPREKVIFANREFKYSYIEKINACIHIDDDAEEKFWLDKYLPDVKMIWLEDKNLEQDLISTIDTHDHVSIWLSNENNLAKLGFLLGAALLLTFLFA